MQKNTFVCLCCERLIDPEVALDNEDLVNALTIGDDNLVILILNTAF